MAVFGAFMLSGCSYSYDVLAQIQDGRLIFDIERRGFKLFRQRECFTWLSVAPIVQPKVTESGVEHDEDLEPIWSFESNDRSSNSCIAAFPIAFGDLPAGAKELVSPRRLERGRIYEVIVNGPGAMGSGRFRVITVLAVDNLAINANAR